MAAASKRAAGGGKQTASKRAAGGGKYGGGKQKGGRRRKTDGKQKGGREYLPPAHFSVAHFPVACSPWDRL